eukprot:10241591-Alexandrium_andersonii.AAC.1
MAVCFALALPSATGGPRPGSTAQQPSRQPIAGLSRLRGVTRHVHHVVSRGASPAEEDGGH